MATVREAIIGGNVESSLNQGISRLDMHLSIVGWSWRVSASIENAEAFMELLMLQEMNSTQLIVVTKDPFEFLKNLKLEEPEKLGKPEKPETACNL
jgi:hypothetical protein